jgi:hypothetical protein
MHSLTLGVHIVGIAKFFPLFLVEIFVEKTIVIHAVVKNNTKKTGTGGSHQSYLATWEAEIGRIAVPGQLRQKVSKISLNQ